MEQRKPKHTETKMLSGTRDLQILVRVFIIMILPCCTTTARISLHLAGSVVVGYDEWLLEDRGGK